MQNPLILPDNIQEQNIAHMDILSFDNYKCEKCNSIFFVEKIITKKVPKLYQSILKTDLVDIRILACESCGELHEVFKNEKDFVDLVDGKDRGE